MKLVNCPVCEKRTLGLRAGPGRTMKHRNLEVPLPDDLALPECSSCGARPIDWKTAKSLDPILQAAWEAKLSSLVAADLEVLAAIRPLYEWERLLKLSVGYLSKIRGEKTPGAQLVVLLRLLANDPERAAELESLWAGASSSPDPE